MTIEEAVELVLSGEGAFECYSCSGEGGRLSDSGSVDQCWTCEGLGKLASTELLDAHRLLGLESPNMVSYEESMGYAYDD